jgi:apolipoprotein N-acyltransferase
MDKVEKKHSGNQVILGYKPKIFTQGSFNAMVISGILGFLMFPFVLFGYSFPDMGVFAWIYLVPLLLGIHRLPLKGKFVISFMSAMLMNFGSFYWLMTAMQLFGKLNFFQAFAMLLIMCAMFSLFHALFISMASWTSHMVKMPLFLLIPIFMVAHNVVLHYFPFNGFPFGIAPYTQGAWIDYFQWVDHTGIFGLSLVIFLVNGLLADGLLLFIHRKQPDKLFSRLMVVFVVMLLSLYCSFLSSQSYEKNKKSVGNISIAMIQGNIPQDTKWDPFKAQDNLNAYLRLTNNAVKDGADLVMWPETAYPYGIKQKKMGKSHFLDKEGLSAPILFGAVVTDRKKSQRRLYNAVILADKTALMSEYYHKIHLVPFGEYLPFKELLSSFGGLIQGVGEFDSGSKYTLFSVKDIKLSALICFEDVFPFYARRFAQDGANILFNVTNDAWYGDSSMQYQHLVYSQFRALENRRYLLRSTNTGFTGVISPSGVVVEGLKPFTEDFLLYNLKVEQADSFYTKYGHGWVYLIVILCFATMIYAIVKVRLGPVKVEF